MLHKPLITLLFCITLEGLPKAAVVTHERVWAASFIQSVCGVTSDDIFYINLPLYHSAGFLIGMAGAIERGNNPVLALSKKANSLLVWTLESQMCGFILMELMLCDLDHRYDHFSEEKVLCLSILGRLQEVQRDCDAVYW